MGLTYLHGLHWPDWDEKAEQNYQAVVKSLKTMDLAIMHAKRNRLAVQAGGHCGIFGKRLGDLFDNVIVYEPHPDLFRACIRNIPKQTVRVHNAALSDREGMANFHQSSSSGSCQVIDPGKKIEITNKVHTTTLDSLNLPYCDFLMLDIEGHELQALQGAFSTIKRCRPVIQLEELEPSEAIDKMLKDLRYFKVEPKQGKDRVYLP